MGIRALHSLRATAWIAAAMSCTPAMAGWQYAEWGRSSKEVLAETSHRVRPTTADEKTKNKNTYWGEALAAAPHVVDGENATAFFHFKNDHLSAVVLKFQDVEQGFRARRLLREQYGAPDDTTDSGTGCRFQKDQWRLEGEGNNISFDALECKSTGESVLSITYSPIPKASETGL